MKYAEIPGPTVLTPKAAEVTQTDERQSSAPCNARPSKQRPRVLCGLSRNDRLLVANEEPPVGSHLVTPRRGFAHHGIYVGSGNVVHYRSVVRQFCRGPVEEVSLAGFAQERAIWVRGHRAARFNATEVMRRARSRLGEDRYRLFSNNCEHFCEWCLRDEHRSYQLERLLTLPRRLLRICGDAVTRLFPESTSLLDRPIRVLRAPQPQHVTLGRQLRLPAFFFRHLSGRGEVRAVGYGAGASRTCSAPRLGLSRAHRGSRLRSTSSVNDVPNASHSPYSGSANRRSLARYAVLSGAEQSGKAHYEINLQICEE